MTDQEQDIRDRTRVGDIRDRTRVGDRKLTVRVSIKVRMRATVKV